MKKCDYVICLKRNQETLHEDVKLYFEAALAHPQLYDFVQSKPKTEKGHGSISFSQKLMALLIRRNGKDLQQSVWCVPREAVLCKSEKVMLKIEMEDGTFFVTFHTLNDIGRYPFNQLFMAVDSDKLEDIEGLKRQFRVENNKSKIPPCKRRLKITKYRQIDPYI